MAETASGLSGVAWLRARDEPAPVAGAVALEAMVKRCLAGEPLQYVLGRWSFRRLELLVDSRVLIPRPETEILVEVALGELRRLRSRAGDRPLVVVDLGTGSGAIALAVASEAEESGAGPVRVWATDSSGPALEVAAANRAALDESVAGRVELVQGDWWQALPGGLRGSVDLVVSNPPYVAEGDALDPGVSDWEPPLALWSAEQGLEATARILAEAPAWLRRPGVALVEIASHRSDASLSVAETAGFSARLEKDMAGRDRIVVATLATCDDRP